MSLKGQVKLYNITYTHIKETAQNMNSAYMHTTKGAHEQCMHSYCLGYMQLKMAKLCCTIF